MNEQLLKPTCFAKTTPHFKIGMEHNKSKLVVRRRYRAKKIKTPIIQIDATAKALQILSNKVVTLINLISK